LLTINHRLRHNPITTAHNTALNICHSPITPLPAVLLPNEFAAMQYNQLVCWIWRRFVLAHGDTVPGGADNVAAHRAAGDTLSCRVASPLFVDIGINNCGACQLPLLFSYASLCMIGACIICTVRHRPI